DEGRRIGYTDLYDEHVAEWAILWEHSKVTVDSDQPLQKNLNASIYHMLRAHRKGEARFSICPKAHAGEAYFGRYFWDTEIFLLPFFIYTDPAHARDMLRFRISTLPGAKRNAARYGYIGARYAWESSLNGDEECPNWQYADHEVHVTADVVYGLVHYIRATGDIDFALREAFPVFVETARYWVSRTDFLEDGTRHLLGVMGPDEYSPFSRDNAYTNWLVCFSLNATVEFANLCRLEHPDLYAGYERDLQLTEKELQLFSTVAGELPVVIDSKLNIVLQSADFETCAYLDELDSLRAKADPVATVVSQERLYRSKALKQGDVVMLFALFPDEYSQEIVNRSFDYYEALTTHDSSLSPTMHALVASRLGRKELAERFFSLSLDLDFHPQKGDASQGIHAANAGGNWQIAVFGYAGVRPAAHESTLRLRPSLPESVRRIATPLCWRGRRLDLIVTRSDVQIMLLAGAPLEVEVSGEVAMIEVGRTRTFHYSSS
ncbi:MAG: glycoside hydrolase family 65 protein, partial [Spirochaetaceae bacterium]|nr:glycoside hydrolase family 65 protein [Spirochaetaceae bacterium]